MSELHFLFAAFRIPLGHYGHLMRFFSARGHAVHLWTMEPIDHGYAEARVPGVRCHALPFARLEPRPLGAVRTLARASRLALDRPDATFTLWSLQTKLLCGLPLRALGRRCVFLLPGLGTLFSSDQRRFQIVRPLVIAAYRWMFRGEASRVIVLNRDDLAFVTDVIGVPPQRVFLLPGGCGVDPREFPYVEQLPARRPRAILVPARLVREKGIFEAAHASRILLERGIEHELWFSSGIDPANPLSHTCADVAALPAISRAIRVLGRVPAMAPVYQAAYAVCLPTYREGIPTALVEASATGRPIVTTDAIGARHLVQHEHNGLRVPVGDVGALADALARVLVDDALARRLARNAYEYYRASSTAELATAQALAAYESLGIHV
jgi:glycosyltransferase involved in cell wall biosynthesis